MKAVAKHTRWMVVKAALLIACSPSVVAQQQSAPEPYTDADAYAVYDALLAAQAEPGATIVIQQETLDTSRAEWAEASSEKCVEPSQLRLFVDAWTAYKRLSDKGWLLQRKFSARSPYEIVDRPTLGALTRDNVWDDFRKRFPGSTGVFEMSAVGFNADRSRAVLFFGKYCGGLCGTWELYLMEKQNGKWREVPGVTCHTVS